jgi:hypothetical protein
MKRLAVDLVVVWGLFSLWLTQQPALAVSTEVQSNAVTNGAIAIDGDRSDWDDVPEFSPDTDTVLPGPELDFDLVQVANDAMNLYLRLQLLESPAGEAQPFGFRHNLYIDADQNRETGFVGSGSFLPTGSDFLLQGPALYEFGGATQEEFTWNPVPDTVTANDTPDTDIEVAFPLAAIGSPATFDFFLNAANSDFNTEDFYPEFANNPLGDFFTYEVAPVAGIEGDYNLNGTVEQADLDLVLLNWGQDGTTPPEGWTNDLPSGTIDQAELDSVLLNWGNTAGAGAVPESASLWLLLVGAISALGLLRRRAG